MFSKVSAQVPSLPFLQKMSKSPPNLGHLGGQCNGFELAQFPFQQDTVVLCVDMELRVGRIF